MRYGRITASKIHEIANCHTAEGSLVQQILGASKIIETKAMARGKIIEKSVFEELKTTFGYSTLKSAGLFLNPLFPIIGASPDALGPDFVVEIKSPTTPENELNYVTSNLVVPNRYLAQIQLQMFMTGKKIGYFCVARHDFETSK